MRTLGILTLAVGLLSLSAACSAADESGSTLEVGPTKKRSARPTDDEGAPPLDNQPAPRPSAAPASAPTPPDLSKDGLKSGDETDVDCGGAKAAGCADGKSCNVPKDCMNNLCTSGKCMPPKVQTHYCQQLGSCCSTLTSTVEKIACLAVQFSGKETACQIEIAVCTLGGSGGSGGSGGTSCGDLDQCCDYMQADGYPQDAYDCRSHSTGSTSQCSSWLSQYQSAGWCP